MGLLGNHSNFLRIDELGESPLFLGRQIVLDETLGMGELRRELGRTRFHIATLIAVHQLKQREIARRMEMSQQGVSYHVRAIRERFPQFARPRGRTRTRPLTTDLSTN